VLGAPVQTYAEAQLLERIARESDSNVTDERKRLPGSPTDLRGLPAFGKGCGGGAIRGTRPGENLQ
jgi:hypothetical protein